MAGEERFVAFALMEQANAISPESAAEETEQAATALRKLGCSRILVAHYNNSAYNAIKAGSPERARAFLAEAAPLARELEFPVFVALTSGNEGLEALFSDDSDRARRAFEEQLRVCREHVVHQLVGEGLGGLAAIATHGNDLERAALLLGAANATGTGVGDADVTAQLEERFFAPARAAHGTREWDEAHATGAEMSLEEAIAFALNESGAPE